MWAFGILLYEMLIGRLPFLAPSVADLHLRIKNGFKAALKNGSAAWLARVGSGAKALTTALLSNESERRPTAEEVLQHSWLTKHTSPTGEPLPADDVSEEEPRVIGWWCDVAAQGCLRPTASTSEKPYDPTHRCWQFNGVYMVCEYCHASGQAEHHDQLKLVDALDEGPASTPRAAIATAAMTTASEEGATLVGAAALVPIGAPQCLPRAPATHAAMEGSQAAGASEAVPGQPSEQQAAEPRTFEPPTLLPLPANSQLCGGGFGLGARTLLSRDSTDAVEG